MLLTSLPLRDVAYNGLTPYGKCQLALVVAALLPEDTAAFKAVGSNAVVIVGLSRWRPLAFEMALLSIDLKVTLSSLLNLVGILALDLDDHQAKGGAESTTSLMARSQAILSLVTFESCLRIVLMTLSGEIAVIHPSWHSPTRHPVHPGCLRLQPLSAWTGGICREHSQRPEVD